MTSGYATKFMLRVTGGVHGFNLLTHCCGVLSHIILAVASQPWHLFTALAPMTLGEMGVRQSGLIALHTRAAAAAGMGLGDAAAKLKTLQSALQLGMPILCEYHRTLASLLGALATLEQQLVSPNRLNLFVQTVDSTTGTHLRLGWWRAC